MAYSRWEEATIQTGALQRSSRVRLNFPSLVRSLCSHHSLKAVLSSLAAYMKPKSDSKDDRKQVGKRGRFPPLRDDCLACADDQDAQTDKTSIGNFIRYYCCQYSSEEW